MNKKEIIDEWLTWIEVVRHSRTSTVISYGTTMSLFEAYTKDMKWENVDAQTVEAFMGRVRRGGAIGMPATQDRDRVAISMFYKYMINRGYVANNPVIDVGIPQVHNRQPKAISEDVWSQLWLSDLSREDSAWLGLGCFAGLRRRELATISPKHFDLANETINHFERKGGGTYAIEYGEMARTLADRLPGYLPDVEKWLDDVRWMVEYQQAHFSGIMFIFGPPTTDHIRRSMSITDEQVGDPKNINKRLERLLRRAGLASNSFTPHALRHTCATNLMRCGVPVEITADLLSHANIETTRRYLRTAGQLGAWRSASVRKVH